MAKNRKGTKPNKAANRLQRLTRVKVSRLTVVVTDRNEFAHAAVFYKGMITSLTDHEANLLSRAEFKWTIYVYAYILQDDGSKCLHHYEVDTNGIFMQNKDLLEFCQPYYKKLLKSHKWNVRHAGYIASMIGPQSDDALTNYLNEVDTYFQDGD